MSFVKTFDVLMMSLETFLSNRSTDYGVEESKLDALQRDCEMIDRLVEVSEGISTEVSIDETDASILISCVFHSFDPEDEKNLLIQLFKDTTSVSVFSPDRRGKTVQIDFRFADRLDWI